MEKSNFAIAKIEENADILQLQDSINQALKQSGEIEFIISSMDVETASHFVKNLTEINKTAEELRTQAVKPLNDEVKVINSYFKKLTLPTLNEADRLKILLLNYTRKQAEIARQKAEAERKAAEERAIQEAIEKEARMKAEAAALGLDPSQCKVEVAIIPETIVENRKLSSVNTSGVGTRKVAKWRIKDESLIPDEYWILDETKINAIRRAAGVACEKSSIPGIEFYSDDTLNIR